jgi:hypothetical protein
MRAIVVGFPKSGTTTLQEALQKSGLRCAHWRHRGQPIGRLVHDGWFDQGDPFAHFPKLDVLTQMDICLPAEGLNDWPDLDIPLLLAIRQVNPGCLFILNARDPAETADSILRWGDLAKRISEGAQPGLPSGRGAKRDELVRWIATQLAAMRRVFAGDPHFLDLDIAAGESAESLRGIALTKHTLAAPFEALVIARHWEVGAVAPDSLWVLAHVDEARAGAIEEGQPAEVRLRSLPGELFTARGARRAGGRPGDGGAARASALRRGAARGDRPCSRQPAQHHPGRRADRRAGFRAGAAGDGPAALRRTGAIRGRAGGDA